MLPELPYSKLSDQADASRVVRHFVRCPEDIWSNPKRISHWAQPGTRRQLHQMDWRQRGILGRPHPRAAQSAVLRHAPQWELPIQAHLLEDTVRDPEHRAQPEHDWHLTSACEPGANHLQRRELRGRDPLLQVLSLLRWQHVQLEGHHDVDHQCLRWNWGEDQEWSFPSIEFLHSYFWI